MSSSTYKSVVLNTRPEQHIVLGETFQITHTPVPTLDQLKDGEVVFKTEYISVDPGMRDWLKEPGSYMPPVALGEPMRGFAVGTISASNNANLPVGSHATGLVGWSELKIIHGDQLQKFEIPAGGKLADALSLLGMTSLTAYYGVIKIGQVKPGDFVVVSGAAGATGSIAGQIAKIKGATVLGVAGSDDKVRWLKDIGFDDALNYKDEDFVLGGQVLELALEQAKIHGRIVLCGGVSQVNTTSPQGPKNYLNIIYKRLRVEGFLVFDYPEENAQAFSQISQWFSEGKLKAKETIIKGGLEQAEKALRDIYNGVNTGKLLVEV
ncbi:hypothetical protein CLAIMM_03090 [Cladophialophora immunda]|nr:hypothetical protein CLAIMM_03090 [Cladophialophora immunda]